MDAKAAGARAGKSDLARTVRDSLMLTETLIIESINEVMASLKPLHAEVYKRKIATVKGFGDALKKVSVDMGVVLVLAKTFESDDDFTDAAALLHEVDFSSFDGFIGRFAKDMVDVDLEALAAAESGQNDDAEYLYGAMDTSVIRRRLQMIKAAVEVGARKAG